MELQNTPRDSPLKINEMNPERGNYNHDSAWSSRASDVAW